MSRHGFTLAEVVITMAFGTLAGALVFSFARTALLSAEAQRVRAEAQETAHLALSLLGRDLRLAGFTPAAAPLVGLARAESAHVALRADLNGDGDVDDAGERVSWQENASRGTLARASGAGSPQPVVDHLAPGSLRFIYFDAAGAALDPGDDGLSADERQRVRRVDVAFEIAVPHATGAVRVRVATTVEVRNAPPG